MIHVDLDHPARQPQRRRPAFLPHGGNSPYLEQIAAVLRLIYDRAGDKPAMFAAFEKAGVIEPSRSRYSSTITARYPARSPCRLSPERLATLDGEALARLHRGGFLRLAFLAAASLANVHRLIEMKNRKQAGGPTMTMVHAPDADHRATSRRMRCRSMR